MDCIDCCSSETVAAEHKTAPTGDKTNRGRRISANDFLSTQPINPYKVLELRRDATPSEIVQSYRKLALLHHPGRGRGIDRLEERRRRIQTFETLSACYETLIHNESRRRYDIRLNQLERKQLADLALTMTGTTHSNSSYNSLLGSRSRTSWEQCSSAPSTQNSLVLRRQGSNRTQSTFTRQSPSMDHVPGLVRSTSSDASASDDSSPRKQPLSAASSSSFSAAQKLQSAGFSFLCTPKLTATASTMNFNQYTKSLVTGDSSASRSSLDEPEIQFTETTVNRLFGGRLAHLYRARNFEPFTDPYEVFERVFGSSVFPLPLIEENGIVLWQNNNNPTHIKTLPVRTPVNHKNDWTSTTYKDPNGETTTFVSTRIVRDRKITRTETVHVEPGTGRAKSEVKVESEQQTLVDPMDDNRHDSSPCGLLLCHRTRPAVDRVKDNASKYEHSTVLDSLKSGHQVANPAFFEEFQCAYKTAMEEFYMWNRDLYGTCTSQMGFSG